MGTNHLKSYKHLYILVLHFDQPQVGLNALETCVSRVKGKSVGSKVGKVNVAVEVSIHFCQEKPVCVCSLERGRGAF